MIKNKRAKLNKRLLLVGWVLFFCLLITLPVAFGMSSAGKATLQGKVTDSRTGQQPVSLASITLSPANGSATTDSQGNYSLVITTFYATSYQVSCSKNGYTSQTQQIVLKPGATQALNFSLTSNVTNRPPVLTAIGNKSVAEGANLQFTISAADPDGNTLTYSASGLPTGATFNAATKTFSWTPTYTQAGSYNVSFAVSDGSLSAAQAITIIVTDVPQDTTGPTGTIKINNDAVSTNSTQVTLNLSAQDNTGGSGVSQMQFSNDGTNWSQPEAYAITKAWTLPLGEGTKTVSVKFKDAAGNTSSIYSDAIILDNSPPKIASMNPTGSYTAYENTDIPISAVITHSGPAPLEYRFLINGKVKQDWSSQPTYIWKSTPGIYALRLEVKDVSGQDAKETEVCIFRKPSNP